MTFCKQVRCKSLPQRFAPSWFHKCVSKCVALHSIYLVPHEYEYGGKYQSLISRTHHNATKATLTMSCPYNRWERNENMAHVKDSATYPVHDRTQQNSALNRPATSNHRPATWLGKDMLFILRSLLLWFSKIFRTSSDFRCVGRLPVFPKKPLPFVTPSDALWIYGLC